MRYGRIVLPVVALGVFVANDAWAASCAANGYAFVIGDASVLSGKYISAQNNPGGTVTETWNEDHCSNGDLIKRALGPGDPVDPTKKVGTWTPNPVEKGMGWVRYNYTGDSASPYYWKLYGKLPFYCWEDDTGNAIAIGKDEGAANYCGN